MGREGVEPPTHDAAVLQTVTLLHIGEPTHVPNDTQLGMTVPWETGLCWVSLGIEARTYLLDLHHHSEIRDQRDRLTLIATSVPKLRPQFQEIPRRAPGLLVYLGGRRGIRTHTCTDFESAPSAVGVYALAFHVHGGLPYRRVAAIPHTIAILERWMKKIPHALGDFSPCAKALIACPGVTRGRRVRRAAAPCGR